jgi:hypothetical protein
MNSHDYSTGGTLVAAVTTWGAAFVNWLSGAGFFNPATFIAVGGTCVGFIANYGKLRASWPLFTADVALVGGFLYRKIRGQKTP